MIIRWGKYPFVNTQLSKSLTEALFMYKVTFSTCMCSYPVWLKHVPLSIQIQTRKSSTFSRNFSCLLQDDGSAETQKVFIVFKL